MRGSVRPVGILGVLPVPPVVDHLLKRVLEVLRDERVGVLVDRDARRRMRDVDEGGGGAIRVAERRLDLLGDVHELGLAVGFELDLLHGDILGALWPRRSTNESSPP